jgi:hypothetical protein
MAPTSGPATVDGIGPIGFAGTAGATLAATGCNE